MRIGLGVLELEVVASGVDTAFEAVVAFEAGTALGLEAAASGAGIGAQMVGTVAQVLAVTLLLHLR